MSARYDCADTQQREDGLVAATSAVQEGQLVVLPTDTVYGIGADAFTPAAVTALLAAKGRGRNMPPPVLVGSVRAAAALTESLGPYGQDLIDEFWPGPLTLVFRSSPTLQLGSGRHPWARSRSACRCTRSRLTCSAGPARWRCQAPTCTASPAATSADEAQRQLGDSVSVYLDGGQCADNVPSTILDLTGTVPRMLRAGAISVDALRKVVPVIDLPASPAVVEEELSPADRRAAESIAAASAAGIVEPGRSPADADPIPDQGPGA